MERVTFSSLIYKIYILILIVKYIITQRKVWEKSREMKRWNIYLMEGVSKKVPIQFNDMEMVMMMMEVAVKGGGRGWKDDEWNQWSCWFSIRFPSSSISPTPSSLSSFDSLSLYSYSYLLHLILDRERERERGWLYLYPQSPSSSLSTLFRSRYVICIWRVK